jgi:carboxylate-amine ligase
LHKELLRNTVELTTGICDTVDEAMSELDEMISKVRPLADELGVDLYCAGTHPFAAWSHQLLTEGHRYEELIARTQWWGRQMLIWGVHVHVGVRRDQVIPIVSALLNWYPHLQALSASSPIWAGTDTGYASNRAMMFQQLPTAGLPFQFGSWDDFEHYADDLLKTGVIEVIDEIRWDVRPAPRTGTVEVRVCDGVSTLWEMRALVALTHCLVVDLAERLDRGETLPTMPPWHVQENKWRAARYGLDAWIILDADSNERLLLEDLDELLVRLQPVAERLRCADDLELIREIPRRGASYQRQRRVAEANDGDLVAVVDSVVREL